MLTANEIVFDRQVRQAALLNRLFSGMSGRALQAMSRVDIATVRVIQTEYHDIIRSGMRVSRRKASKLTLVLAKIAKLRSQGFAGISANFLTELNELVALEIASISDTLTVGGVVGVAKPEQSDTLEYALSVPFSGRTLDEWNAGLVATDAGRIVSELRAAFYSGANIDETVDRISNTTMPATYRQIRAMITTAAAHVASIARGEVFSENADQIFALRWTSVLDSGTSIACASKDGKIASANDSPIKNAGAWPLLNPQQIRPPAHPFCRSIMVAMLTPEPISSPSYSQWLSRQTPEFQDEILGPTRGELYRKGGLSLERFTDYRGGRYTVADLRRLNAVAFDRAKIV